LFVAFYIMSKIIVNGCSHTFGWGLQEQKQAWPSLIWPNCVNLAKCGDSNIGIARRTIEYLLCHPDVTHVFVMWTNNDRYEISTEDHRYLMILGPVSWGADQGLVGVSRHLNDYVDMHYRYFFSVKHSAKQFLMLLHYLVLLCQTRGIALLTAASMPIDIAYDTKTLEQQWQDLKHITGIDDQLNGQNYVSEVESYLRLEQQTKSAWLDQSYQWGHVTGLPSNYIISDSDPHANADGHRLIAKNLMSSLPGDWTQLR